MTRSEFDAFGPWIYEIDEEHGVSRIFLPYYEEKPHLMLFKIPRNAERRRLSPDMDLYDILVGAYDDHIRIWRREGTGVTVTDVRYAEIEGVRLFRRFLHGVCSIYSRGGPIEIVFNAVSMDIMCRFTEIIRAHYRAPKTAFTYPEQQITIPYEDAVFINRIREIERLSEHAQICAYQPLSPVKAVHENVIRRVYHLFRGLYLRGTVHLLCGSELVVLEKGEQMADGDEYSISFTVIPIENIRSVGVFTSEIYRNSLSCVLCLSSCRETFQFSEDNKQAAAFYEALGRYLTEG